MPGPKAARRRPLTAPDETPLATLFTSTDDFHLLRDRAIQARVRTRPVERVWGSG